MKSTKGGLLILPGILLWSVSCMETSTQNTADGVKSYGNRQAMINNNDLNGKVRLDSVVGKEDFYALGPVAGLLGEITVYDSEVSVSSIQDGKPAIVSSEGVEAIFLLVGHQKEWVGVRTDEELQGLDAVENYVRRLLEENNIDLDTALVFRIEAQVPLLEYHIIYKKDSVPHTIQEHRKAKQKFWLRDEKIKLVGFWVDESRVGKLTHPGKRTHLHFIHADNSVSGHIDDIVVPVNSMVFIPGE